MKRKIATVVAVFAMMLAVSASAPAQGRHPEIYAAIQSLENAKAHLEAASHDYQGHRVDAIKSIDEAIHQLKICMKYD